MNIFEISKKIYQLVILLGDNPNMSISYRRSYLEFPVIFP